MGRWSVAALGLALFTAAITWWNSMERRAGDLGTQLTISVSAGNIEFVKRDLAKGADARQLDSSGRPITFHAANHDQPALMKLLIDEGALVNTPWSKEFRDA